MRTALETANVKALAHGAAALALLVAAVAGVWIIFAQPLFALFAQRDEMISQQAQSLARLTAVAAYGRDPARSKEGELSGAYAGDFLNGGEDSILIADLQARLRAIVTGRNSEFTSARALPAKTFDGHTFLGVRLQLRGDMRDIHQVLHSIEGSVPLLFVDRIHLRADDRRHAGPDGRSDVRAPLVVELDVFGARWSEPTSNLSAPRARPQPQ